LGHTAGPLLAILVSIFHECAASGMSNRGDLRRVGVGGISPRIWRVDEVRESLYTYRGLSSSEVNAKRQLRDHEIEYLLRECRERGRGCNSSCSSYRESLSINKDNFATHLSDGVVLLEILRRCEGSTTGTTVAHSSPTEYEEDNSYQNLEYVLDQLVRHRCAVADISADDLINGRYVANAGIMCVRLFLCEFDLVQQTRDAYPVMEDSLDANQSMHRCRPQASKQRHLARTVAGTVAGIGTINT
jgi:hypothetical protein